MAVRNWGDFLYSGTMCLIIWFLGIAGLIYMVGRMIGQYEGAAKPYNSEFREWEGHFSWYWNREWEKKVDGLKKEMEEKWERKLEEERVRAENLNITAQCDCAQKIGKEEMMMPVEDDGLDHISGMVVYP